MKRIISISLCVAMLLSMVAMSVSAASAEVAATITNENVMTFTTDKDSYEAGDTVTITVAMESIWGDPDIVDTIKGYEDYGEFPGAYGMQILCSNLIYDTSVFTAKAYTNLLQNGSTILNGDAAEVAMNANNPIEAKKNGCQYIGTTSDFFSADYESAGFYNGSGDLWKYNLTISSTAADGTYYLPVGPYRITTADAGDAVIKFQGDDRYFAWNGNVNSLQEKVPVTYKTNYTGGSRVDTEAGFGTDYECSYVKIVIGEDNSAQNAADAAAVDALIDAIGTPVYNAGEVTKVNGIDVTGFDLYKHFDKVSGSQFDISFKMMPGANGEGFGYFGGTCDANNDSHNIFWNQSEKKFQIAKVSSWMDAREVTEVLAESEVMDLPENKWTDVKFIYNGSYMAVMVNNEIVCETNSASTAYSFYILYPNQVEVYVDDFAITGPFGTDDSSDNFNGNGFLTVTLDSGAAITAARDAYDALNDEAKALVTKTDVLVAAETEYAAIAVANDQLYADRAIAAIDAIGTVAYPTSGAAIEAAEALVATLTETQLALVSNYDTLTAARAEYDRREGLFNQAKADYVIELIDAIGEVTFESRAAIEAAEDAYALLNDAQKALVTNYDVLVAARASYDMYGPIMNAENLITALGTEFLQGNYKFQHFTSTNGYCDVKVTDNNTTGDFTLDVKFMYSDWDETTEQDAGIALFRNGGSYAGYNFKQGAFVIGNNGGFMNGNNGPTEITAKAEYPLSAGKVYTMTINFTGAVATISLDGVEMVSATVIDPNFSYTIFYPQNVDVFFADATLTSNEGTSNDPLKWAAALPTAGTDVLAPVDITAKLAAAEAAVAALTDEQAALLDASYTDALAAAKADIEAKVAELQADADAVEAKIAAIASEADANNARAAYQALTPGAQALVENYADLNNALANITIGYIDAIGEVTPDSEAAIFAAESAYGALTNAEKALVTNYETLKAARSEINAQYAAIANAEAAIAMLQAGGSAIVNNADGGSKGSYSQFLDNAENLSGSNANAPYSFSFDIYVEALNDETNAYIGGSSSNNVFVGYDFVRGTVFVANAGPWGYSSDIDAASIVAEAEYELELQKWYDFKFVMGDSTAEIYVDGELVLETAITEPNGWFIYYPKNNLAYYDNVEFWYNGEKQTSMSTFASVGAGNWTALSPAGDPGYYLVNTAPVGPVEKDADLIAAARAAYAAVPEKAQYAVKNYAVLVEAETPDVDPDAEAAAAVQATIDALDVPATNLNNYADVLAAADAIAEAKTAYDALSEAQKDLVDASKLDAALASYNKALIYNANLNGAVAPQNVVAEGGEEELVISWDAVDGAVKYWVYVDGHIVATTADTQIAIHATAGTHTVKIAVAINANSALGSAATYVSGTSAEVTSTEVTAAPVETIIVKATATENSITANWDAVDGAVYYVTFNVGGTDIIVKTTNTTITLASFVTASTEYTVSVQALVATEGGYEITNSNVFADVTAEKSFKVIAADGSLTWTEVEGATIYWVEITYTNSGKTVTTRYNAVTELVAPATEYTVKVTAYAAGNYFVAEA